MTDREIPQVWVDGKEEVRGYVNILRNHPQTVCDKDGIQRRIIPDNLISVDAAINIIDHYIHTNAEGCDDVLPGWEFYGFLPSGERVYASNRDELRKRIREAMFTEKKQDEIQ